MTTFISKFSASKLKENLLNIIHRFPISFIVIIVFCALLFYKVHANIRDCDIDGIFSLLFACVITFFFSVSVYITSEIFEWSDSKRNLLQFIPISY